jgi:tRNA(Ile)-lysidine synthase
MMPDLAGEPVGADEFASLMAPLGPFESQPRIAVACSGGRDSMALTLLIRDWAAARGGDATALIVDHALRPESAAEAGQVAKWLQSRGIAPRILRRCGPIPSADIQAAARNARYTLMSDWCEANQCLHLAVGHHLDDQAETFLLRLARGSGVDGLAAIAPVSETRTMRIVRPLLRIPGERLARTLAQFDMPDYVEDPSNRDSAFARVRMRRLASTLGREGMTPRRLADTAARMARARAALEDAVAGLLAHAAVLHAAGYCFIQTMPLRAAPREVALRALARVLICIGGRDYPPRLERLERLYAWLFAVDGGRGRTLSGCRVLKRESALLICREPAAATSVLAARDTLDWDNRFRLRLHVRGQSRGEIRRLGNAGWRRAVGDAPALKSTPIPAPARPSLPALWSSSELLAVPHLGYCRQADITVEKISFSPKRPLITARFTLH